MNKMNEIKKGGEKNQLCVLRFAFSVQQFCFEFFYLYETQLSFFWQVLGFRVLE
jgi:hypothetical protein